MSPHDELDLDQIDALLGEDFSEDEELLGLDDDDDFDDLLGADEDLSEDEDEDSLDELLGAIDDDYLSEKEQVFLQNKSFLDSHNTAAALDKFFMDFQETLYGAMCDYAGEHEEEFGADEDELSDIEIEVDLMGGHCFGSDEEAEAFVMEMDGDQFGIYLQPGSELANASAALSQGVQSTVSNVAKAASGLYTQAPKTRREMRRARRMSRRMSRRARRADRREARKRVIATKRRYIRQLRQLNRCVKRFNKVAAKVSPDIAIKVLAGKQQLTSRPFTTLALASQGKVGGLQQFLSSGQYKGRDRRLMRIANRCDRKYTTLQRIYRGLIARGKKAGIQPPRASLRSLIAALTYSAKKASKKSGGFINAVAAAKSSRPSAQAKRKSALELAKIRAADLKAKQKARKELTLAKLQAARQAIAEKKSEDKMEREELSMVASNPYMDAADMLALDRARQDRMATSAASRQAKIQEMQRRARAEAQQKRIEMLRKQRALQMKRRQAMQAKVVAAPAPVVTKGPASVRKPAPALAALKRRIEIVEKQLVAASAAHRRSLETQNKFPKGSTAWNAQYQKTKAFAQKSSELRAKLSELKSRL